MRVRGKGQWTQAQCEREGSWLRKYPNRRLYDIRASVYVRVNAPDIRSRLLAGERVLGGGGCREDVTAEVLAGLLTQEVQSGRINAQQLLVFLNQVVGDVPAVCQDPVGSPARLV